MRAILPASFLAPRKRRTGLTSDYFRKGVAGEGLKLARKLFQNSALADLGVIDPRILLRSWEKYAAGQPCEFEVAMITALHVERWLQTNDWSQPLQIGALSRPVTAPLAC
jgi:hypothetical protein